jgi:hypothetical protein
MAKQITGHIPHESESIPTVEELGVRGKWKADELARDDSVPDFVSPSRIWESLDRTYGEELNVG